MSKKIIVDGRALRHSTGRYTRKLLDYLQKIDTVNQYVVLVNPEDDSAWAPLKKSHNFSKVIIDYRHYSISEQIGFARFLHAQKADLVWFTMPQQPIVYFGKTVTTIHDLILLRFQNIQKSALSFRVKQFVFRHVIKLFARRSEIILTLTKHTQEDIANYTGVSLNKIKQIYLSADPISAKPKSIPALSGKKFIMYVGTAHVHKNLPRMLQAFEELKRTHPDLHVAFAGNKTIHYERLELQGAASEDSESIHVLGRVSDAELRWMFENAAVYVFPTLDEGFGLPGLEAMQYDVPVAASNASCLPEVYQDAVEYFNPLDTGDMARGINEILKSKRHAKSLISKGHKLLKQYSWEKAARETHAALTEALEKK